MTLGRKRTVAISLLIAGSIAVGAWQVVSAKVPVIHDLTGYREALFEGLATNNFSRPYATKEDQVALQKRFAFLRGSGRDRSTVIDLVKWLNANLQEKEVWSVRATELLEEGSAACEVHALAVAVVEALGGRARWISNARSSPGFGYLEAYVDGHWELFKIRDPNRIAIEKSAWELYREEEPTLSVRLFHSEPNAGLGSAIGSVTPAVFPLANEKEHPTLRVLFTTSQGISIQANAFDPFDFVYGYFQKADREWVASGNLMKEFERRRDFVKWASYVREWLGGS